MLVSWCEVGWFAFAGTDLESCSFVLFCFVLLCFVCFSRGVLVTIANELPLTEGLRLERRLFQQLFATQDQKEGEILLFHSIFLLTSRRLF